MPIKFTRELLESCTGNPPQGCKYCDRGTKMVLYITGLCSERCFYCPLSEEKKGKDVIYANERKVKEDGWIEQIIDEASRMKALGTGITGGDPMLFPDRTATVIRELKQSFGANHHVHLYTSGSFDTDDLHTVREAGLDEIRFHPAIATWKQFLFLGVDSNQGDPMDARKVHDLVFEARRLGMSTGIEVPAVVNPARGGNIYSEGLHILLDYAAREGLDFVNINELEASHMNMERFSRLGYSLIGDSMAVQGSMKLAMEAIARVDGAHPDSPTVFHICSSVYKDSVQLRKRLIRTAKNVARAFEVATDDGTLMRGIIETDEPMVLKNELCDTKGVPEDLLGIGNGVLLIAPWVLEDIASEMVEPCYISEVYPTWDSLEVERIPL